jgi:hypothetical protein
MIQKKYAKDRNIKNFLLIMGSVSLVLTMASPAGAQELLPVGASSVGVDTTPGTPIEEIISAAGSGGLSGAQNFSALKPDTKEQTFESSISSESPPPAPESSGFTSDSLKNLESQGGLSSDPQIGADTPTVFNLAVKFFEKAVFKKDVEFAARPRFDAGLDISGTPTFNKDTAGYAIIKKGNQSVAVDFEEAYNSPPVVTATLSLQQYKDSDVRAVAEDLLLLSDVKYIITDVSKKSFEIKMDHKADSDIPFSWHALSVNDPTTSKKKGESLKSVLGSEASPKDSVASPTTAAANSAPASPAAASQQPDASQPTQ